MVPASTYSVPDRLAVHALARHDLGFIENQLLPTFLVGGQRRQRPAVDGELTDPIPITPA